MKLKNSFYFIFLLTATWVMGQKRPIINSIDPVRANVSETVTISGSGFPTNAANLQVNFGGVAASNIISNSSSLIEVEVPANAPHDNISITDLTSGSIGISSQKFALSYGGETFDPTSLQNVVDINTSEQLLFDLCDCDFDGDGLIDLATSSQENNASKAKRIIYRNTSTQSTINLSNALEIGNKPSSSIICDDMDGDGNPEIIATQRNEPGVDTGTENVEIFQNNSNPGVISFPGSPSVSFPLPRDVNGDVRTPFIVRAGDLDNDGKKDLIVTNSDNYLHIYRNTSSPGSISFSEPDSVDLMADIENLGVVELADLNNDNRLDIVYIPNNGDALYFMENLSSTGVINFPNRTLINPAGSNQFRGIALGDLNNDEFIDIVLTDAPSGNPSRYVIVENTTQDDEISFNFFSQITIDGLSPFGLDLGDLNGDGLLDIVVAPGASTNDVLDILINQGNLSFSGTTKSVNNNLRNIKITDLNNDAKPDLAFVSNSLADEIGDLSYIINNNCVEPAITPATATYCNGVSLLVKTAPGVGLTYNWEVSEDGGAFTSAKNNNENFLDISSFTGDLDIRVTATSTDGCSQQSALAEYTPNSDTPNNPDIDAPGAICVDAELTLTSPTNADEYFWSGPNGFEATTTSGSVTVTSNATSANSGTYTLFVKNTDGCNSQETTERVTIESPPVPNITVDGLSEFCEGSSTDLLTADFPGFNFQWNDSDGPLSGETNRSITISTSGEYSVTLIDPSSNCENISDTILISEVELPISEITSENEICENVQLDILGQTNSSAAGYTLNYLWEFTDSNNNTVGTDNTLATAFTFDTEGEYTATLTTGYEELDGCTTDVSQTITVSAPPAGEIITPDGIQKCPSDSVLLQAPADQVSYQWSTGQTGQNIFAKTAQNDNDTTISVTYVTDISCEVTANVTVSNFPGSGLSITTPNPEAAIENNELIMPDGELNIRLDAEGGSNYSWEPADIFDNSTSASVTAFPTAVSTEITLSGVDNNGCNESTSLTLIANSVIGRRSFSPDGNGQLDCWEILNSSQLQGCTVYIFDKRGKNIFTGTSPFAEDCVWDGNSPSGQEAPEGVYYYVLKCDDSQFDQSGSILLARITGN